MNALSRLNNISGFLSVPGNKFFFTDHESNLSLYADGKTHCLKRGKYTDLRLVGDEVWAFDDDARSTLVIRIADLEMTALNYAIAPVSDSGTGEPLICRVRENDSRFIGQVDPLSKAIVTRFTTTETKFIVLATGKGCLSCDRSKSVWFSEFGSTDKKWNLNFADIYPYERPSQVGNIIRTPHAFFMFLTNLSEGVSYCINSETGAVLKQIGSFGGWFMLSENNIYIANPYNVRMLNVNTYEVTTIELNDLLEPHGWSMMWNRFAVQGNNFYFVHQQAGGGDEAIVGIIDLTKKELLWHTAIPIEEGSYWVDEIQVHENKLFVLTQGGTLHIFEQE